MGSSASSLRGIAPAAKALIVLALLFVAGAVATLQPRDHALVTGLQTRPPPRKRLHVKAEPAKESNGCAKHRRRRPRGSEPLPRGVVQEMTNLEMETSLGGNPERRKQETSPPPKKKSLLAIPVGIKNKEVVNKLVSKFPAEVFTVMLFHYDGTVEQWGDMEWSGRAVHVAAPGQAKWWFAKRFLHPDVVAEYEYVFLWDEDIEVDTFDPVRYLDIVKREGLEVSQPALDRRSEIHHAITARVLTPTEDGVHRRVRDLRCSGENTSPPCAGWVEMMVPVFSRAAWRCAWNMVQGDLIHGWGLDYMLGYCAQGDRTRNVGVVDSEYVLHRGIPVLSDGSKVTPSAGRGAVRWRAFKEMQMFNRRWKDAAAEDKSWTDPYAEQPATASSK